VTQVDRMRGRQPGLVGEDTLRSISDGSGGPVLGSRTSLTTSVVARAESRSRTGTQDVVHSDRLNISSIHGLKEHVAPGTHVNMVTEVSLRALLTNLVSKRMSLGPGHMFLASAGLCASIAASFTGAGVAKNVSTLVRRARRGTILLLLSSLISIAIYRYNKSTLPAQQRQRDAAVESMAEQKSVMHVQTQTQQVQAIEVQTQTLETQRVQVQTQTQNISSSQEKQMQHAIEIHQMPNDPQLHVVARSRTASRAHRRQLASTSRIKAQDASTHVNNAA